MRRLISTSTMAAAAGFIIAIHAIDVPPSQAQWATRDARFHVRGPWNWTLQRELNDLYREFNGIDFGHAHLAETLLKTLDDDAVERARLEVLDFIFSKPSVPPDEDQLSPEFTRMAWEVRRTFDWTHTLHRSLYDLFASDEVADKRSAYSRILADYTSKPEAITHHHLDHHGKLWSFPESKTFRDKFPKFNSQIWAYHWLQAATYDVQLMGDARRQRELMPSIIEHYHRYLRDPPVHWRMMPMMREAAPEFTRQFPAAAAIFDNLHMLHDNVDDILCRPDLYPTRKTQRDAMLRVLDIYLHRNHEPVARYPEYMMESDMAHTEHDKAMQPGAHDDDAAPQEHRPPSAQGVLNGRSTPPAGPEQPASEQGTERDEGGHDAHSGHGGH
jgi:hypothetical protein